MDYNSYLKRHREAAINELEGMASLYALMSTGYSPSPNEAYLQRVADLAKIISELRKL